MRYSLTGYSVFITFNKIITVRIANNFALEEELMKHELIFIVERERYAIQFLSTFKPGWSLSQLQVVLEHQHIQYLIRPSIAKN